MGAQPPTPDEPNDALDRDLEAFLEAWDEADREAAALLCTALDHLRGQPPPEEELTAGGAAIRDGLTEGHHPFAWIRSAAGLDAEPFPGEDAELVLRCTAATISPREETGLDPEEEAILLTVGHADWLRAIVSVVRRGPGADASPETLVRGISARVEAEPDELDFEDETHLETAFWIVALPWQVLGLTNRDQQLTALGAWALPRALARSWGADFDAGADG